MILTGPEIVTRIRKRSIVVDPFDPALVNPTSLDVRLGSGVFTYDDRILDPEEENTGQHGVIGTGAVGDALILQPGRLYLLHTLELVWARDLAVVFDGKSSLGRLGMSVHQTAGYGDPGFEGQYTMEVTVVMNTRVRVGMRIGQLRFHETVGDILSYQGKYVDEFAAGAVQARPEKLWK